MFNAHDLVGELMTAVINNDVDEVSMLLNQGVDPNATLDRAQVTALHHAAQNNALEVIPLLIEYGADPYLLTVPEGYSALDLAVIHNHPRVAQILTAYHYGTDETEQ